jgi:hypothetical protein
VINQIAALTPGTTAARYPAPGPTAPDKTPASTGATTIPIAHEALRSPMTAPPASASSAAAAAASGNATVLITARGAVEMNSTRTSTIGAASKLAGSGPSDSARVAAASAPTVRNRPPARVTPPLTRT